MLMYNSTLRFLACFDQPEAVTNVAPCRTLAREILNRFYGLHRPSVARMGIAALNPSYVTGFILPTPRLCGALSFPL
jgi:hypothetical protein